MAASTFGPKNEPQFADADGPDVAVNPTQAAAYAAKVGNRKSDTATNRGLATGSDVWDGLEWYETDTGSTYLRSGSSWILQSVSPVVIPVTTFGTNWTAGTGPLAPVCYRQGNRVDLVGSVILGASGGGGGYTNILTVPSSVRPPSTSQRFVGVSVTATGVVYHLAMTSGVLAAATGYSSGSGAFSSRLPLNCFWYLD
jgi:hypothetical protein